MKYIKVEPRINTQIIDAKTEKSLITFNDRTWINLGEVFTEAAVTNMIEQQFKNAGPDEILVIAVNRYKKIK